MEWILGLLAGLVGGNLAGAKSNLGMAGNHDLPIDLQGDSVSQVRFAASEVESNHSLAAAAEARIQRAVGIEPRYDHVVVARGISGPDHHRFAIWLHGHAGCAIVETKAENALSADAVTGVQIAVGV